MIPPHPTWHTLHADEVIEQLSTSRTEGLDAERVEERQSIYGFNTLPKGSVEHPLRRFLRQLHAPLVYILLLSGVITVSVGGITDAAVIFGVVFLNAIVGYLQEGKAISSLYAISTGHSLQAAQTAASNTFVVIEMFYLFNCRTLVSPLAASVTTNMSIVYGAGLMALLQAAYTYVPAMNLLFATEPLSATMWAIIVTCGVAAYLAVSIEKSMRWRFGRA